MMQYGNGLESMPRDAEGAPIIVTYPTFSVIICTHNRAGYLAGCVVSLLAQQYSSDAYEIVVVDNASTDNTPQLIEQLRADVEAAHRLHYVLEPCLGLNRARNTGAEAARLGILAYIDDDAQADAGWLASLARTYQEVGHGSVCIGGRVDLWWDSGRPDWLPRELECYYSGTYHLGNAPRLLEKREYPIGTNLSLPRALLLEAGGFPHTLGRLGNSPNDEVSLCVNLRDRGVHMHYAPDAVVYHRVPAVRATRRWLLRRAFWQGVSDVVLEEQRDLSGRATLLRHAVGTLRHAIVDLTGIAQAQLRSSPADAVKHAAFLAGRLGRVRQQLVLAVQWEQRR
jgi:glycosyltransferase involved in cell wall biosynthesis